MASPYISPVSAISTSSSMSASSPIPEGRAFEEQEISRLQTFGACYEIARKTYGIISSLIHAWKDSRENRAIVKASGTPFQDLQQALQRREAIAWTPQKVLEKLRHLQTDLYYLRAPAVAMMQKHLANIEASKEKIIALENRFKELTPLLQDKDAQKRNPARSEHQKIAKLLKEEIAHLRSLVQYTKVEKKYKKELYKKDYKKKLTEFHETFLRTTPGDPPEIAHDLDESIFEFRTLDKINQDLKLAQTNNSKILQALFAAEKRQYPRAYTHHAPQRTPERMVDPLDDEEYTPNTDEDEFYDEQFPIHHALWQSPSPSRSEQLRSFSHIRKLDLPLDESAPEKSVLQKSLVKSNILTQSALLIHKLCRDHSLFDQGEWKKDSCLTKYGATGFADLFAKVHKNGFVGTEGIVRSIGFVITDLFLHINSFFDKHGYSSTDEIVARFKELKQNHGTFVGGTLAALETVLKTLSTLISFALSIGAISVEALFYLLSKASAAIIGSLVYLLTLERVWIGLLLGGTVIGGIALHALNITAIILLMVPYGVIRYFARKNERPDFMNLTVDQRNAHVLGLEKSRHPPLHYFWDPIEVLTNKDNQTAFLDTFTRREIDYNDGFHKSPTEKFLETCTLKDLKERCKAYTPTTAGFSQAIIADLNQHEETNTPKKRTDILRKLHYYRMWLSYRSCNLPPEDKRDLKNLLNLNDATLLIQYVDQTLSARNAELMGRVRRFTLN